jgi:hypothetical protein
MAAVVEKLLLGSQTTLATTALNSQANNALVACTVFDNTIGQTGDGYTLCDVELFVTFGTNPTANTGFALWFLGTQDGTNYEDGDSSTTPARLPDAVFPVRAVTTAQRIIRRMRLPWGKVTPLLKNDGTGQSTAASGNTLKVRPVTREVV